MNIKRQRGFTLIEVAVVVMIVATISAMSLLAINQAFDRRYSSEAEKLLIWLQQVGERSSLEGAAYGVMTEWLTTDGLVTDEPESFKAVQLRAVVYYRMRWVAVTSPEPFILSEGSRVDWLVDSVNESEAFLPQEENLLNREASSGLIREGHSIERLLPEIAFLPDGYIEPLGEIRLGFESIEDSYGYQWEDQTSTMVMERYRK